MALIEIDGLAFLISWVDLSLAIAVSHNQRVTCTDTTRGAPVVPIDSVQLVRS